MILGGDASFSLIHRRLSAAEQRFLDSHGSLSTVATLRAMARAASDDAALVEPKPSNRRGRALARRSSRRRCRRRSARPRRRRVRRGGGRGAAGSAELEARRRHSHRRGAFRDSDHPGRRAGPAGDRHRLRAARAHVASGARRHRAGSAGLAGPLDDPRHHGRSRRRAERRGGPSSARRRQEGLSRRPAGRRARVSMSRPISPAISIASPSS